MPCPDGRRAASPGRILGRMAVAPQPHVPQLRCRWERRPRPAPAGRTSPVGKEAAAQAGGTHLKQPQCPSEAPFCLQMASNSGYIRPQQSLQHPKNEHPASSPSTGQPKCHAFAAGPKGFGSGTWDSRELVTHLAIPLIGGQAGAGGGGSALKHPSPCAQKLELTPNSLCTHWA